VLPPVSRRRGDRRPPVWSPVVSTVTWCHCRGNGCLPVGSLVVSTLRVPSLRLPVGLPVVSTVSGQSLWEQSPAGRITGGVDAEDAVWSLAGGVTGGGMGLASGMAVKGLTYYLPVVYRRNGY